MVDKRPVIGITMDLEEEYFKVKALYSEAIYSAGALPVLLPPHDGIIPYIKNLVDGLVISGGGDIPPEYYGQKPEAKNLRVVDKKRIEFELKILKEFLEAKKPVLGICYGMQLINVFFGGSLFQDIKNHSGKLHEVEIIENILIPHGKYTVNSSHHQAIKETGTGIIKIGISKEDDIIEAIAHKDYPYLFGIQWHPERMETEISLKIFKNFVTLTKRKDGEE